VNTTRDDAVGTLLRPGPSIGHAPAPRLGRASPAPTFQAETFFDYFAFLVDAPSGIQKLRELILQLAVRGKLVPQDPEDEPASAILEKVKVEQRHASKDGKIKGIDPLPQIRPKEVPWSEPMGWKWIRAGEVFTFVTSGSRGWAQFYSTTGPIFLRIGNLNYNTISLDLSTVQRVTPPNGAEGTRTKVQPNDILVSITGDTGMIGLIPVGFEDAYINQHIALVRPSEHLYAEYLARYFTSPTVLVQLRDAQRGIKNSLGLNQDV
jgi:type I restriction enzyme, S subunit